MQSEHNSQGLELTLEFEPKFKFKRLRSLQTALSAPSIGIDMSALRAYCFIQSHCCTACRLCKITQIYIHCEAQSWLFQMTVMYLFM